MKKRLKKTAILARPGPGFMGGALLAILIAVSPVHAGWLVEEQKLTAYDMTEHDHFGASVAISGDLALIGADLDDDAGDRSGSAYIFARSGQTWSEQAKLTALDAEKWDQFGSSVAASGNTAVVGAPGDDDRGTGSGSAYVFIRNGDTWIQQAKLNALDAAEWDGFGSVAISGDTVVVGASGSGSAYVFVRSGTTWIQQAKLRAPDAAAGNNFGVSVAVSSDSVVVGAYFDSDGGHRSGSAYVFVRSGATWSQQAKLLASDASEDDNLGKSVSISDDTVVVGATGDDHAGNWSGSAYVFVRGGTTWGQQAKLTASDAEAVEWYGSSVAVSGDTVVVGAVSGDNNQGDSSGSAYVFVRNGTTWNQQVKLIASDAEASDSFGYSVAVSGDAVVVGAIGDDDAGFESGSAYVIDVYCDATYSLPPNQWRQVSLPCDPGANNTVAAVFGDDIPGTYGSDWLLYHYDANRYVKLSATDTLSQGEAYWIFQRSGNDSTLDMPDNSTPTPVTDPPGCLDTAKGCFEIPLATQANIAQWKMVGYPFAVSGSFGNVRVQTDTGVCASGCDLNTAQSQGIVSNQFLSFNGTSFTKVDSSGNLDPWKGYLATTLQNADGLNPRLLVPRP